MTDSVGAQLRQAREFRRLSLQQASEITKLRIHYLQALENDDYSAIPSAAQARGFLRNYAEFLELDLADLVPPQQAIVAVPPVSATAPASPASPSSTMRGFWGALRERLGRRVLKDVEPTPSVATAAEAPAVVAAPVLPVPEPMPPVETIAEAAVAPATTDVKTKTSRRTKTASDGVKKNGAS